MKNLVFIFNHERTEGAIVLKRQLSPFFDCLILDSGSTLSLKEKNEIDYCYGNIYYNGLVNKAFEIAKERSVSYCTIITSDVIISDPEQYAKLLTSTIINHKTGVYMPSCDNSIYRQHLHRKNKGLVKGSLSEGFCFTINMKVMSQVCPIDLNLNRYGFGTSHVFSLRALQAGLNVFIDHRIRIHHPPGSGYAKKEAYKQQMIWMRHLGKEVVWHRYLVGKVYFQAIWFQKLVYFFFYKE